MVLFRTLGIHLVTISKSNLVHFCVIDKAMDYDAGDNATVTYSLTSTVSALSIDPQTGALDIADSVADYCSNKCDITVTATDTLGLSASQQATVAPF
jgi:hypothetical protein